MTTAFGLPTFPIADAMQLGSRTHDELQWLIDRGDFVHWHNKRIIHKVQDNHYQLLRNTAPEPELEAEATTLDALIKDHVLPIQRFQWHPHWQEDPA